MKDKDCIIVATPVQQHSFRLANALKKAGLLNKYYTTVYVKDNSLAWKVIGKILPKLRRAIGKKQLEEISDKTQVLCGFKGLVFYFLVRLNYALSCKYYFRLTKRFGKKVAKKAIKNKVKVVVMFDFTAIDAFKLLKEKAPNILRILDMSSVPVKTIDGILDREEQNGYGEYAHIKRLRYPKKYCKYFEDEIKYADYFLVAGEYSKQCLIEEGAKEEQCLYVPYGVNLDSFKPDFKLDDNGVLNFVFTGRIESAKGVLYVLKALKRLFDEGYKFIFHLVGTNSFSNETLDEYKDFCVFHGYLSKNELIDLYHKSQVFVMCSLWEGRSLSTIEALSCGLPCLISYATGLTDCVVDGKNGFVVPPADENAIYEKAKWFIQNADKLKEMSKEAVLSVGDCSWEKYENDIKDKIFDILGDSK